MTVEPTFMGRRLRNGTAAAAVMLGVAFLGLLAYGLAANHPDDSINSRLAQGQAAPAPGFELPVLTLGNKRSVPPRVRRAASDGRLGLGELRGAPVVLNFWASWCPPCRDETPILEGGWRSWRRRGLLVLGLNMQDVTSDARAFLTDLGATYPHVRDGSDSVARQWGVTGLPETFFVDRRGRVVGHVVGAIRRAQFEAGVRAARQGVPVGTLQGGDRRPTP